MRKVENFQFKNRIFSKIQRQNSEKIPRNSKSTNLKQASQVMFTNLSITKSSPRDFREFFLKKCKKMSFFFEKNIFPSKNRKN